jgi:hypothetical protein
VVCWCMLCNTPALSILGVFVSMAVSNLGLLYGPVVVVDDGAACSSSDVRSEWGSEWGSE